MPKFVELHKVKIWSGKPGITILVNPDTISNIRDMGDHFTLIEFVAGHGFFNNNVFVWESYEEVKRELGV